MTLNGVIIVIIIISEFHRDASLTKTSGPLTANPNRRVISLNSVDFGADYVKVIEDTPTLFAAEM